MHFVPILAIFSLNLNSLSAIKLYYIYFVTISVILLDTRACIILFDGRYSHLTSDDSVPVLQFIVDISGNTEIQL